MPARICSTSRHNCCRPSPSIAVRPSSFIRSTESTFRTSPSPDRLWAYATWRPDADGRGTESIGDVRVVDGEGAVYLELHGARLSFLARDAVAKRPVPTLCVAATFTAEPLADSLNFWADQFATPIEVTFSPYNQIFQQLLDPGSAFHQNATAPTSSCLRWRTGRAIGSRRCVSATTARGNVRGSRTTRPAKRSGHRPLEPVRDGLCLQGDLRGPMLHATRDPPA